MKGKGGEGREREGKGGEGTKREEKEKEGKEGTNKQTNIQAKEQVKEERTRINQLRKKYLHTKT